MKERFLLLLLILGMVVQGMMNPKKMLWSLYCELDDFNTEGFFEDVDKQ